MSLSIVHLLKHGFAVATSEYAKSLSIYLHSLSGTCIVALVAFSDLDQLPVATHVGAEESSQYRFRSPFRFQKRLRVLVCVVALQWREWFMLK